MTVEQLRAEALAVVPSILEACKGNRNDVIAIACAAVLVQVIKEAPNERVFITMRKACANLVHEIVGKLHRSEVQG